MRCDLCGLPIPPGVPKVVRYIEGEVKAWDWDCAEAVWYDEHTREMAQWN